jgi:hypothetical protein
MREVTGLPAGPSAQLHKKDRERLAPIGAQGRALRYSRPDPFCQC